MKYLRFIVPAATALGLLVGLATGVLGGYYSLQTDYAKLEARVADHQMRLDAHDRTLELYHKEQIDYQAEMRGAVAHAVDLLTDVRLQLAKGRHG